jgi:stage II sporulation protein P
MNYKYKRKSLKKVALKILMIPILIILSFLAVKAGITVGNLVYDMDTGMIQDIDTENFKSTIDMSLPIINSIYNSGNISVSVSGEIKSLVKAIFNFDLDTPLTILNVQSPLFYSYYNNEYKKMLAYEQQPEVTITTPEPEPTIPTPTPSAPLVTATPTGTTEKVAVQPTPTEEAKEPISYIAYEEDDEEDEEDKADIVKHDKLTIQNHTSFKIDIQKLLNEAFQINFNKKGPKVLIYHTHTTESYVIKEKDLGKASIAGYNTDPRYNVVRVGEELARNLKKYGIDVLHNGTVHNSNFPAAYGASLKTIQQYAKSYPSIKIMFDIHRDGLSSSQKLREVTTIKGKKAAKVMFVVGTNGNGLPHPNWKENLKFALHLQSVLNDKYPGLAKPIWVSKNRYNQQVTNDTLIIEVGGDGNLLSECLESTKYLAEAINTVINEK